MRESSNNAVAVHSATAKPVLPDRVVYFNFWTVFEGSGIGNLFEMISCDNLARLKPGDTVWIDIEQPVGKIYGYDRAEVTRIEPQENSVIFGFNGPKSSSSLIIRKSSWHRVHRCTDVDELLRLINEHPLALEDGTESYEERGHLREKLRRSASA